jgi:antirestriction protein ArdC
MNRQEMTNKIIDAMEKGVCPWKKPWANIAHRNIFSRKIYRGMNQILLSLNKNALPYWGTFLQWKDAGCGVRKGEKASQVVFFTTIEVDEFDDEGVIEIRRPVLRYYNVFHIGQVNDPDDKFKYLIDTKIESDFETANKILMNCGAEIRVGGNVAFYCVAENYVRIPFAEQFDNEAERIAIIFHELGHWGDRNILGKELSCNKESPDYAYGELVAELTACFLCQNCAVPSDFENHESDIATWIAAMKNDYNYLWRASRDASKISDAILQKARILQDAEIELV